jgi:hypothetical protein
MENIALTATETGDDTLDALMAELDGIANPALAGDEIVLTAEGDDLGLAETTLEAAVAGAELSESYDIEASKDAAVEKLLDAVAPAAATETEKERAKRIAAEEKEKKRLEREAKKAADADRPKTPRVFYGKDKVKRLMDRGVATVLLTSDLELTGDDLAAKQKEVLDIVAASSVKVKNRTSNILEFVTGKTATLNNVIRVIFKLAYNDGEVTTGEKDGSMFKTLLECYERGTVRSAGNNSIAALKALKVLNEAGPARYVPNPDSALFPIIAARLGLGMEEGDDAEGDGAAVEEAAPVEADIAAAA